MQAKEFARVAAADWELIRERMRALDGSVWHRGDDPELFRVEEGPDAGAVYWRLGNRQYVVDGDAVVETTIGARGPVHRRVIGPNGIISDAALIEPGLN